MRLRGSIAELFRRANDESRRTPDGNCPIREHTGDGVYVGRCDFAVYGGICPRHGVVADYYTLDDRDVPVANRRFGNGRRTG